MPWVRLDDKRADNSKLMRAGFEARGLDEAAICWAAGHASDGHIPEQAVAMLAAGHGCKNWKKVVVRLVDVGRWTVHGDGWDIHDFLEFNPSAAQANAARDERSKVRADAGRLGGQASGRSKREAKAKQVATEANIASATANATEAKKPRPDPSRPSPPNLPTKTHDGASTRQTDGTNLQAEKLAQRWMTVCDPKPPIQARARAEARWWMPHLLNQLDYQAIDECIGMAEAGATTPPRSISYLTRIVRDFARTHDIVITDPPAPDAA